MARTPAKRRNDSVQGKRDLLEAANTALAPVQPLNDSAQFYFEQYISTRPSFSWTRGDLVRLTKICERLAEVDHLSELIKEEGYVVINAKGTQIPNPLLTTRDSLERLAMAGERGLSLYSPITGSAKANTYEQAKEVERLKGSDDDDLLS